MAGPSVKSVDRLPQEGFSNWPFELQQLATAGATGNLDALQTFFSQWQSKTLSSRSQPETICPALSAAVRNNQVATVTYLLDQGVPVNQELFLYATESKLYQVLDIFLQHGWDINTPVDFIRPPALA